MKKQELIDLVAQSGLSDQGTLIEAVEFTDRAMRGLSRLSGEPAVNHGFEAGALILNVGGTVEEVAAAVMHDLKEDTPVTLDEIGSRFGSRSAFLVESVSVDPKSKLLAWPVSKLSYYAQLLETTELLDIMVLLIKLADRLHNMRTLEFLQPRNRELVAWETTNLLLPLAQEMGQRVNGRSKVVQSWLEELEELTQRHLPSQPEHFPDFRWYGDIRTILRAGAHSLGVPSPLSSDL